MVMSIKTYREGSPTIFPLDLLYFVGAPTAHNIYQRADSSGIIT